MRTTAVAIVASIVTGISVFYAAMLSWENRQPCRPEIHVGYRVKVVSGFWSGATGEAQTSRETLGGSRILVEWTAGDVTGRTWFAPDELEVLDARD